MPDEQDAAVRRFGSVIERIAPSVYLKKIQRAVTYAGFRMSVGTWLLITGAISLVVALAASVLVVVLFEASLPFVVFIGMVAAFMAISMGALYNVALYYGQKRAVQIEEVLPDALQLTAANLRADIPIHKSLVLAARPEFGLLAEQFNRIGEEIMTGTSVDVAFDHFSERVDSPLVRRVSTLMRESLRSGHDIAGLLEQIAHDVRSFRILEGEAKANISSYIVFIVMAVIVIAPILYSISISFVDLSTAVRAQLDVADFSASMSGGGGSLAGWITQEQSITPDDLVLFAGINLFVAAIFAALVVSVLQTGESLRKLPLVPVFVCGALLLFIGAITLLRTVLLGMFFV